MSSNPENSIFIDSLLSTLPEGKHNYYKWLEGGGHEDSEIGIQDKEATLGGGHED